MNNFASRNPRNSHNSHNYLRRGSRSGSALAFCVAGALIWLSTSYAETTDWPAFDSDAALNDQPYSQNSFASHFLPNLQAGFLANITNDRNSDVSQLSITFDDSGIVQGVMFSTQDTSANPPTISNLNFTLGDLAQSPGVVLVEQQGHKVIFLRGTVDSQGGTGALVVRYLSNGLWGSYEECNVNVARGADQAWHLLNAYTGAVVDTAEVVSWNLGITTIKNICPN